MRLGIILLSSIILIGCSTAPRRTVLMDINRKNESNREISLKDRISIHTSKGITLKLDKFEIEAGKLKTGHRHSRVVDKLAPGLDEKRWGIRIIIWFKELI